MLLVHESSRRSFVSEQAREREMKSDHRERRRSSLEKLCSWVLAAGDRLYTACKAPEAGR